MDSPALDHTKPEEVAQPETITRLEEVKLSVRELTNNEFDQRRLRGHDPKWLETMVVNYLLFANEEANIAPTEADIRQAVNDVLNGKFKLVNRKRA